MILVPKTISLIKTNGDVHIITAPVTGLRTSLQAAGGYLVSYKEMGGLWHVTGGVKEVVVR